VCVRNLRQILQLTEKNCVPENVTSRLDLGSACYCSFQDLLSSLFISKNLKIKYTKL